MVTGLETFRNYFGGDEDKYVLIGGAACDICFEADSSEFRATKEDVIERLTRVYL